MQMCILDGRMYDEMGVGQDGDGLDSAALLSNNSGRPLLVSGKGAKNSSAGHVLVPLEVGLFPIPPIWCPQVRSVLQDAALILAPDEVI